jgi:hypothetical protein
MQHARLAIIPESDLRLLVRRAGPPAASVCGRHLDTAVYIYTPFYFGGGGGGNFVLGFFTISSIRINSIL